MSTETTTPQVINPSEDFKNQRDINCKEALSLLQMNGFKFWSWGPRGFTNVNNKALRFRVSGHHHKGYVYISVTGMDLYEYHLTNLKNEVKKMKTGIFFDELFDLLDVDIEKIPEYKD